MWRKEAHQGASKVSKTMETTREGALGYACDHIISEIERRTKGSEGESNE
jgi:hypothetical protein